MALACARCGTQNPDGNLYCQACGSPLAAPPPHGVATAVAPGAIPGPPPGPPPGFAAPAYGGAAGYQSPYYTPAGPPVPMHRTPWTLIVAGVVALVLVMAGAGTVLALLGSRNNGGGNPSGGTATTIGIGAGLASPSPGVTPSPVASPVSTTGTTESNDGVSVAVPAGWTVQSKDSETIVLLDPNTTGTVTVASGSSVPAATSQDNKTQIDSYFKQNYPDAAPCAGTSASTTTFHGVGGIAWQLCFTVTSGGNSVRGEASLFVGANQSGSVYYLLMLVSRQDNMGTFIKTAAPVMAGIQWKLS